MSEVFDVEEREALAVYDSTWMPGFYRLLPGEHGTVYTLQAQPGT